MSHHHQSEVSPFKLLIEVHQGHNLAIKDYTTSDPYVIVYLGDKMVGRTETISKNHINPKWNQLFTISLYHLKHTISFKVYDEDKMIYEGTDDFMGAAFIDLLYADLVNNERKTFDKLFVIDKGNTKGHLCISLLLKKSKNLVQLQPKKGNVYLSGLGNVFNSPLERIIRRHYSLLIREDMIRELRDVILGVMSIPGASSASCKLDQLLQHHNPVSRSARSLSSSTWQNFENVAVSRPDTPFKEFGIKLRMRREGGGGKYDCLLTFPTRFCAWKWLKWIRVACDYWNEKMEDEELPVWAVESDLTVTSFSSHIYVHGTKLSGRLKLSLDNFWLITCDETTKSQKKLCSLDLRLCEALVVSPDSLPWNDVRLQLEELVVRLEGSNSKDNVGDSMSSAVDTRRRPTLSQDGKGDGEMNTSVLIRTDTSSHNLVSIRDVDNFIWIESFGFDFQSETVSPNPRGKNDGASSEWQQQKSGKSAATQGFEVFLYQGPPEKETSLVGSKFILMSDIMAQLESSAKKRSVEASCVSGTAHFLLNTKTGMYVFLYVYMIL